MKNAITQFSKYYPKLREEISILQNITNIFDKVEEDGNLKELTDLTEKIVEKEMNFALNGNNKKN